MASVLTAYLKLVLGGHRGCGPASVCWHGGGGRVAGSQADATSKVGISSGDTSPLSNEAAQSRELTSNTMVRPSGVKVGSSADLFSGGVTI